MRLMISAVVVAMAGLATAYDYASHSVGGQGGGVRANLRGGVSGGQRGRYHQQDPYGLFLSFTDPYLRHQEFSWKEAAYQCAQRGLVLVSLDSYDKDHYVSELLAKYHVRYIWTSATKKGYAFKWVNGKTVGQYFSNWSLTGGGPTYHAQPDNREGNEYCLAVLNNFYYDGIRWHDIACYHKKAFICEAPTGYYRH